MNNRIKLAEAMGWTATSFYTSATGERDVTRWRNPEGKCNQTYRDMPNPEHDANDCHALIKHLRGNEQITVTVTFGRGVRFDHDIGTHSEIATDNWMQGVCELALKVLK